MDSIIVVKYHPCKPIFLMVSCYNFSSISGHWQRAVYHVHSSDVFACSVLSHVCTFQGDSSLHSALVARALKVCLFLFFRMTSVEVNDENLVVCSPGKRHSLSHDIFNIDQPTGRPSILRQTENLPNKTVPKGTKVENQLFVLCLEPYLFLRLLDVAVFTIKIIFFFFFFFKVCFTTPRRDPATKRILSPSKTVRMTSVDECMTAMELLNLENTQ